MSALTSLLARDAAVPVHAIEDALQRQALEGGDVETALLELGAIAENALSAYRAATFGLHAVSREELIGVSDDTLKLVPVDVARRMRVVPVARSGRALVVSATGPLPPDTHSELEDLIGLTAIVRVAVAPRIEIALATYYGVEASQRIRGLAENLERTPAGPLPEVAPAENLVVHLSRSQRETFDSEPPVPPTNSPTSEVETGQTRAFEAGPKSEPSSDDVAASVTVRDIPASSSGSGERRSIAPLAVFSEVAALPPLPRHSRPHFRRVSTVPKGPLSADKARQLLDVAVDRDAVIDIFFSFAKQYFDCSALFAVRDGRLIGLEAYGLDAESPSGLDVAVGAGGVVDDVTRSLLPRVAHIDRHEQDADLVRVLARETGQPAALIPVVMRQRVVSLLYGDRDGEMLRLEDFGELLGIVPKVVQALSRVIRERKIYASLAPSAQTPGTSFAPTEGATAVAGRDAVTERLLPASTTGEDDRPETREAMAMLGMARPAPRLPDLSVPPSPAPSADGESGPDANTTSGRPTGRPGRVGAYHAEPGTEERVGGLSADATAAARPARGSDAETLSESDPSAGWRTDAQTGAQAGSAALSTLPSPQKHQKGGPGTHGSERRRTGPRRADAHTLPVSPRARREEAHTRPVSPRGLRRPRSDARLEGGVAGPSAEALHVPADLPDAVSVRPPAPTKTPVVDSQPRLPEGQLHAQAEYVSEMHEERASGASSGNSRDRAQMPSIIVDMGADVERLVDELAGCGPDDEGSVVESLLKLGAAALPALAARFPGTLWFERRSQHQRLPAGGDISAVARALHAFGAQAAPYMAQLLSSSVTETRFYAILLASERCDAECLPGLLQAALDDDPQVRILARDTLPGFRGGPGFTAALATLRSTALNAAASVQRRIDALEALCAVRDVESFDVFLELNAHSERQLAVPAHRALMLLSGRDFGTSVRRWRSFAKQMVGRERAEWLIDGLTQSDEHLRATAGSELQKLTQVYFGYVANAPKRERERVQRRYRDWWEEQRKTA